MRAAKRRSGDSGLCGFELLSPLCGFSARCLEFLGLTPKATCGRHDVAGYAQLKRKDTQRTGMILRPSDLRTMENGLRHTKPRPTLYAGEGCQENKSDAHWRFKILHGVSEQGRAGRFGTGQGRAVRRAA